MTEMPPSQPSHEELLAAAQANLLRRRQDYGSLATFAAIETSDGNAKPLPNLVQSSPSNIEDSHRISQEVPITI